MIISIRGKHLAKIFLIPLGGAFHSNLGLSDLCLQALKKLPTFYQRFFNLWTKQCSTGPKNMAEILGQSLWDKKFVRCKDKPIYYRQFSDRGINTISDLITEDRKFLRWSQARDKYQLSNKDVMKWLGLIESTPRDRKSFIKNDSKGLVIVNTRDRGGRNYNFFSQKLITHPNFPSKFHTPSGNFPKIS